MPRVASTSSFVTGCSVIFAPSYVTAIRVPALIPRAERISEGITRSEEHTSELQSHLNLVCRLLLEKKKNHAVEINIAIAAMYPLQHLPQGLTTPRGSMCLSPQCTPDEHLRVARRRHLLFATALMRVSDS